MLIVTSLIIQAIFISAIFLFVLSTPKILYYMFYLRHSISQIRHVDDNARRFHMEGKLTKDELEELLEYYQSVEGKKKQFRDEMQAWEKFSESMNEPLIETLMSLVLVIVIAIIPENLVYDQNSWFLFILMLIEVCMLVVSSVWIRKMEASYDIHFRDVADLIQKKRKGKNERKERGKQRNSKQRTSDR